MIMLRKILMVIPLATALCIVSPYAKGNSLADAEAQYLREQGNAWHTVLLELYWGDPEIAIQAYNNICKDGIKFLNTLPFYRLIPHSFPKLKKISIIERDGYFFFEEISTSPRKETLEKRIIDPISAYLDARDTYQTRELVRRIKEIAKDKRESWAYSLKKFFKGKYVKEYDVPAEKPYMLENEKTGERKSILQKPSEEIQKPLNK